MMSPLSTLAQFEALVASLEALGTADGKTAEEQSARFYAAMHLFPSPRFGEYKVFNHTLAEGVDQTAVVIETAVASEKLRAQAAWRGSLLWGLLEQQSQLTGKKIPVDKLIKAIDAFLVSYNMQQVDKSTASLPPYALFHLGLLLQAEAALLGSDDSFAVVSDSVKALLHDDCSLAPVIRDALARAQDRTVENVASVNVDYLRTFGETLVDIAAQHGHFIAMSMPAVKVKLSAHQLIDVVTLIDFTAVSAVQLSLLAEDAVRPVKPGVDIADPIRVGSAAMKISVSMMTAVETQQMLQKDIKRQQLAESVTQLLVKMGVEKIAGGLKYAYPAGFSASAPERSLESVLEALLPSSMKKSKGFNASAVAAKMFRVLQTSIKAVLLTQLEGGEQRLGELNCTDIINAAIEKSQDELVACAGENGKLKKMITSAFIRKGEGKIACIRYLECAKILVAQHDLLMAESAAGTLMYEVQKMHRQVSTRATMECVDSYSAFMVRLRTAKNERAIFQGMTQSLAVFFEQATAAAEHDPVLVEYLEIYLERCLVGNQGFKSNIKRLNTPETFLAIARAIFAFSKIKFDRAARFAAQLFDAIRPEDLPLFHRQLDAAEHNGLALLASLAYQVNRKTTDSAQFDIQLYAANMIQDAIIADAACLADLELVKQEFATVDEVEALRREKISEPKIYAAHVEDIKVRVAGSRGSTHDVKRREAEHQHSLSAERFDLQDAISTTLQATSMLLTCFATSTLPLPKNDRLEQEIKAYREQVESKKFDSLPAGFPVKLLKTTVSVLNVAYDESALRKSQQAVRGGLRDAAGARQEQAALAEQTAAIQKKTKSLECPIREFVYKKHGLDKSLAEKMYTDRPALPSHFHPIVRDMMSLEASDEGSHDDHRLSAVFNEMAVDKTQDSGVLDLLWPAILLTTPSQLYGIQQRQYNVVDCTLSPLFEANVTATVRVTALSTLLLSLAEQTKSKIIADQVSAWMLASLTLHVIERHQQKASFEECQVEAKHASSPEEVKLHVQFKAFTENLREQLLRQFPRHIVLKYGKTHLPSQVFDELSAVEEAGWGDVSSVDAALDYLNALTAELKQGEADNGPGAHEYIEVKPNEGVVGQPLLATVGALNAGHWSNGQDNVRTHEYLAVDPDGAIAAEAANSP